MIFSLYLDQNCYQTVSKLLLLLVTGLAASPVFSAEPDNRDTRFFHAPPTVEEMADHLFPRRTRGIVITEQTNSQQSAEKSIGLPVLFHFGKTTLVDSSKPFLDRVGELMQQPEYSQETLIVEGHTDAVGSAGFNQRLSELRALAVKDYLVQNFDIDPRRLFPDGKGESQLFYPENPRADENRRVEFLRY